MEENSTPTTSAIAKKSRSLYQNVNFFRAPGIVRHSNLLCFLVLLILILLAVLIEIPEYKYFKAYLGKSDRPMEIATLNESDSYFFKEGDMHFVRKNDTLVKLKKDETWSIRQLREFVDGLLQANLSDSDLKARIVSDSSRFHKLGDVQTPYDAYVYHREKFKIYYRFITKQRNAIRGKQTETYIAASLVAMDKQLDAASQSLELAKTTFETRRRLLKEDVGALQDMKLAEAEYLRRKNVYDDLLVNRNKLVNEQYNLEINALDQFEKVELLFIELMNGLREVKTAITAWEKLNVVKAPFDGYIYYNAMPRKNILESRRSTIFLAPQSHFFVFSGMAGQHALAGLKKGEAVNLVLTAYDKTVYGKLKGRVNEIAYLAYENHYYVDINVPSLQTTFQKDIPYKDGLEATVEVLYKKRNILQTILLDPLFNTDADVQSKGKDMR